MKTQKTRSTIPAAVVVPAIAVSHAEIADRAYEIWLRSGQPANRDLEHWLQAEAELNQVNRRISGGKLRDPATRLSADPLDPASNDAARMQEEIENLGSESSPRSATSL